MDITFARDQTPLALTLDPDPEPSPFAFTRTATPSEFEETPMAYDSGPANNAVAVTPDAANAVSPVPRALFVGTGGDLVIRAAGDSTDVTLKNVPDGAFIPIRAQYVRNTSTAADIVALY